MSSDVNRTPDPWQPLKGIRVVAFTHVAAGPYATLQLAYLGAEVIKIESATRIDPWRLRDRNHDPEGSRTFADHNKNTLSATINLKHPDGIRLARQLIAKSDVVIDNYSAGVLARLGLGDDVLREERDDLIIVHLSGLGSKGPRSHFVTFGPSMMAISGMTHLWNHPDQESPVGSQTSYPDYLVGAYAAYVVLAALHARQRDGNGFQFDLSQLEVVAAALGPSIVASLNEIEQPQPRGNQSDLGAPHGCYPCADDDSWCVISVTTDDEWRALCGVMGDPSWAAEDRFATHEQRLVHRADLDDWVARWTATLPARTVFEQCQEAGVPAGIVASGKDLASDPHLLARGFLLDMTHPKLGEVRLPGPAIRPVGGLLPVRRLGPLTGEDNQRVFGEILAIPNAERQQLEEAKVIH